MLINKEEIFIFFIIINHNNHNFLIVLDPRLKLNYYKENHWERRYINSAQKLIYDVYQAEYAPNNSEISINENDGDDDLTSQIYKRKRIAHNSNELDLYLKDPNAQEKTDVLLWWKVKPVNNKINDYINIIKMYDMISFL